PVEPSRLPDCRPHAADGGRQPGGYHRGDGHDGLCCHQALLLYERSFARRPGLSATLIQEATQTIASTAKMYAGTRPVSSPRALKSTGKMNGITAIRIPTILAPLMALPKSRTASATVRERSDIRLNGSMIGVGST